MERKSIFCPTGALDFSDKILSTFDYVVASVHSSFKMTEAEMTKRILKAIKNKYVTVLGHPTGRLLLQRDGYPLNQTAIIDAAADYGKCIEINAHPSRLDLDWRMCKYAKEKGVKISINPDAHVVDGLRDVRYGVGIARKGWLEKKDVLEHYGLAPSPKISCIIQTVICKGVTYERASQAVSWRTDSYYAWNSFSAGQSWHR